MFVFFRWNSSKTPCRSAQNSFLNDLKLIFFAIPLRIKSTLTSKFFFFLERRGFCFDSLLFDTRRIPLLCSRSVSQFHTNWVYVYDTRLRSFWLQTEPHTCQNMDNFWQGNKYKLEGWEGFSAGVLWKGKVSNKYETEKTEKAFVPVPSAASSAPSRSQPQQTRWGKKII